MQFRSKSFCNHVRLSYSARTPSDRTLGSAQSFRAGHTEKDRVVIKTEIHSSVLES